VCVHVYCALPEQQPCSSSSSPAARARVCVSVYLWFCVYAHYNLSSFIRTTMIRTRATTFGLGGVGQDDDSTYNNNNIIERTRRFFSVVHCSFHLPYRRFIFKRRFLSTQTVNDPTQCGLCVHGSFIRIIIIIICLLVAYRYYRSNCKTSILYNFISHIFYTSGIINFSMTNIFYNNYIILFSRVNVF